MANWTMEKEEDLENLRRDIVLFFFFSSSFFFLSFPLQISSTWRFCGIGWSGFQIFQNFDKHKGSFELDVLKSRPGAVQ